MRKLISSIDATLEHSRFAKLFFTARRDLEYLTGLYQDSLFADQMIVTGCPPDAPYSEP
jgi:hypothetical protein